jgi:hypothetical protein
MPVGPRRHGPSAGIDFLAWLGLLQCIGPVVGGQGKAARSAAAGLIGSY